MKLPNGVGRVYKLNGNRRKVAVLVERIVKPLLIDFRKCSLAHYKVVRVGVVGEKGLQSLLAGFVITDCLVFLPAFFIPAYGLPGYVGLATVKNYTMAYKHCEALYNMKMADIRTHHLQAAIDNCPTGYQGASRIRFLFNKVFGWCMLHECLKKNYAEHLTLPKQEKTSERRAFTKEHIAALWSLADANPNIPIVLMLIYSGVRIRELLNLKKEDVNLTEQYFKVRESKTAAGIRIVPIADKVLPFWQAYNARSKCEYAVCTTEGQHMIYENFMRNYWNPLMKTLNMDYVPHETRHTCVSLLIMANVNPTIRKKIVGHKGQMDIGEAVYGHINVEELLKAINMI